MVLLSLTTEWPLRRPHDASQSHHSDSELLQSNKEHYCYFLCVCVQIWLLVWEAGEKEVWMCRTSFPGSPIPVLRKSTHQGFHFVVVVLFCFLWSKRYSEQKWTEQLLHSKRTMFHSVHSDETAPPKLLCENNRGDSCSWWRGRTFSTTLRAGDRTGMAKQQ